MVVARVCPEVRLRFPSSLRSYIQVLNQPCVTIITNVALSIISTIFQTGGTKLERFLPKNQHTQRKLLNFENWINKGHRSLKKSEF